METWSINKKSVWLGRITNSKGEGICTVDRPYKDHLGQQQAANAALIASAPDMLALLDEAYIS